MGFYDPLQGGGFDPFSQTAEEAVAAAVAEETGATDRALAGPGSVLDPGVTLAQQLDAPLPERDLAKLDELYERIEDWTKKERSRRRAIPDLDASVDPNVSVEEIHAEIDRRAVAYGPEISVRPEVLAQAAKRLFGGFFGLETHLEQPDISDILINRRGEIYVEAAGRPLAKVPSFLRRDADLDRLITRLAEACAEPKPIKESPTLDGNFDYTDREGRTFQVRVNIVLSRLTSNGSAVLSIRKPNLTAAAANIRRWHESEDPGLTRQAAEFLLEAVRHKLNVVIVGGTGSGKTTLLQALIDAIPREERIVTCEQAAELRLPADFDVVPLVVRNSVNSRPEDRWTIGRLIEIAMRQRPDRIIVGECRKPDEVSGFIQAVNTGHDGSITTVHASSAYEGLDRLLTLAAMDAGKAPLSMIGKLVAQAVDLVVFIGTRTSETTGRRRHVMEIIAIREWEKEKDRFVPSYLFGRYAEGSNPMQETPGFDRPLRCFGVNNLPPRLRHKLEAFGLDESELSRLLAVG